MEKDPADPAVRVLLFEVTEIEWGVISRPHFG